MNKILVVILGAFAYNFAFTQSINNKIYDAFVLGEMNTWLEIGDSIKNAVDKKNNEDLFLLLELRFGYASYLMGTDEDKAEQFVEESMQLTEEFLVNQYRLSDIYAIQGSLYGFKTSITPWKAMSYGPKSLNNLDKAIEADSLNPVAWMYYGNADFYRPALFGGDKEEALRKYLIAKRLMERDEKTWFKSHHYLNLLATLGQAYTYLEDYENAEKAYNKALEIAPNFEWVKNELLPEMEQRRGK